MPKTEINVTTLSIGAHIVSADITDSNDAKATSTILIEVMAPNAKPVLTINSPYDGSSFTQGDNIIFTGTAIDPEDGDISNNIDWSSSLDGDLGTGASLSLTTLTIGSHTITASITDDSNAVQTAQLSIMINDKVTGIDIDAVAPLIEIYPNPVVNNEVMVEFTGEANALSSISIFDAVGKVQKQVTKLNSPNSLKISLSTFSSGLIFLRFEYNDYSIIKKVIKQ